MLNIIISRYNEDIGWIDKIKDGKLIDKIFIYNKGEKNIHFNDKKIHVFNVKNIGREGGTYLDYIINNYDNFPKI